MHKQLASFWLKLIAFLCLLALAVNSVGTLLDGGEDVLKSASSLTQLPANSADVLWLGTSHMNFNVIPQYLYDEYGITSVMATGNSVDLASSYWELQQALLTQSPQVVVLDVYPAAAPYCYFYVQNVLAMENREAMQDGNNPYNTASGVARWLPVGSPYKVPAILESWRQFDIAGDAFFQITRMHGRYSEIGRDDFEHAAGYSRYIRNFGYLYSATELTEEDYASLPYTLEAAMEANDTGRFWTFTDEQLSQVKLMDDAVKYLKRIADYTREKGIQLVLCAAPYVTNAAEEKMFAQVEALADEWNVPFVGLDEPGIEGFEYVRDLGHLNHAGALLYTEFWGEYFSQYFDLPDRRESMEERYAPWRSHPGSHDMQDTAMHLMVYEGGPTGYLEQVSTLDDDYLVLMTMQGTVYEGFTEDDYWILTEEMGAVDEAVEEWYYTGTGTLDLILCGDELLTVNYEPEDRSYPLKWNVKGNQIALTYNAGTLSTLVNDLSTGYMGDGMNIAVYSRLEHRVVDSRIFDLTEYYFDE